MSKSLLSASMLYLAELYLESHNCSVSQLSWDIFGYSYAENIFFYFGMQTVILETTCAGSFQIISFG